MKPVSSTLSTWLDDHTQGVWADCYTITPRGGSPVYLTTHTAALLLGGHSYQPGGSNGRPLVKTNRIKRAAGLDPGSLECSLLGGSEATWNGVALSLAALESAFDGAWIRVDRVFGDLAPDVSMGGMPVHEGPVSRVKVGSYGVELTVADGREDLLRPFPRRIVQPGCNWAFGSTECGISLASHTFNYTSASGSTTTRVNSSSFTTKADSYFALGTITFTGNVTASLAGVARGVAVHDSTGFVDVDRPLPVAPANGDTFSVVAGCPKTLAACGHNGTNGKFGVINSANYGGFPFVPNPDTVSE